jgi:hypothetical protein
VRPCPAAGELVPSPVPPPDPPLAFFSLSHPFGAAIRSSRSDSYFPVGKQPSLSLSLGMVLSIKPIWCLLWIHELRGAVLTTNPPIASNFKTSILGCIFGQHHTVVPAFGRKISDFSHCLILADGLCIGKGLGGLVHRHASV